MVVFRALKASEVECKVKQVTEKGVLLLLYKDARVDQNILDETVGAMNWQRHHSRDNANCIVSIWDDRKEQWIEKEDTGTESNTEAEKGLASDSFKRACFNWGIGRELYTAPLIWISAKDCNISQGKNGKCACYDKFTVETMSVENGEIKTLSIRNAKTKKLVFSYCAGKNPTPEATTAPTAEATAEEMGIDGVKINALTNKANRKGVPINNILQAYKCTECKELTLAQWTNAMSLLDKYKDK